MARLNWNDVCDTCAWNLSTHCPLNNKFVGENIFNIENIIYQHRCTRWHLSPDQHKVRSAEMIRKLSKNLDKIILPG